MLKLNCVFHHKRTTPVLIQGVLPYFVSASQEIIVAWNEILKVISLKKMPYLSSIVVYPFCETLLRSNSLVSILILRLVNCEICSGFTITAGISVPISAVRRRFCISHYSPIISQRNWNKNYISDRSSKTTKCGITVN